MDVCAGRVTLGEHRLGYKASPSDPCIQQCLLLRNGWARRPCYAWNSTIKQPLSSTNQLLAALVLLVRAWRPPPLLAFPLRLAASFAKVKETDVGIRKRKRTQSGTAERDGERLASRQAALLIFGACWYKRTLRMCLSHGTTGCIPVGGAARVRVAVRIGIRRAGVRIAARAAVVTAENGSARDVSALSWTIRLTPT